MISLIPAFVFGAIFVAVGATCIYFALKGQTLAQGLNKGECAGLGSAGAAFASTGLCTLTCVLAGGTLIGKRIAAFFMAAGAGLLGIAFLAEAILDPAGIKSSIGGMRLDTVRVNAHFSIGSVAFSLGGSFLLYQTPAIYRSMRRQLDAMNQ